MTWTAKRFYRTATVIAADDGFAIGLDGRPVRTPAGASLRLPTAALAQAVAEEWLAQKDAVRPHSMPLTRLAATATDRVGPRRAEVIEHLIAYASTDLLCYRAEEPLELAARQERRWGPLLEWAAERWGAALTVTAGVVPVAQPESALQALRAAVESLNDLELTALASAVQASGSLVVGLALTAGRLDADTAFEVSHLDEIYQVERWGEDAEAAERRRRLRDDLRAAAAFLTLARDEVDRASADKRTQ